MFPFSLVVLSVPKKTLGQFRIYKGRRNECIIFLLWSIFIWWKQLLLYGGENVREGGNFTQRNGGEGGGGPSSLHGKEQQNVLNRASFFMAIAPAGVNFL
jgi:hypothetical protein